MVGVSRPEVDNAVAMIGLKQTIGLGRKLDEQLAVIELFGHATIGAEQAQETGVGGDEGPIFPEHEAVAAAPVDGGYPLPEIVAVGDVATGRLPEQAGPLDWVHPPAFDAVKFELSLVTAGPEGDRDAAPVL